MKKEYKPVPYRYGNEILCFYTEDFIDSVGNIAELKCCDYIDKRKILHERYILSVNWKGNENIMSDSECFLNSFYNYDENYNVDWYDGLLSYFFKYKEDMYFSTWNGIKRDYFEDEKSSDFMVYKLRKNAASYVEKMYDLSSYEVFLYGMVVEKLFTDIFVVCTPISKGQKDVVLMNNKALEIFNKNYYKYCNKVL